MACSRTTKGRLVDDGNATLPAQRDLPTFVGLKCHQRKGGSATSQATIAIRCVKYGNTSWAKG
jgi:hypothetical protein